MAKNIVFFYKGWALLFGIAYFSGSICAAGIYFKWFAPAGLVMDDKQKFIVLITVFYILLAFSVWVMSTYVTFQIFLSRPLESWVRQKRNDRRA